MASEASSSGIGFCGLLTILFIGLKLTGHITWSWIWVLSPLWIGFIFIILFLSLLLGGVGILAVIFAWIERKRSSRKTSRFWEKVDRRQSNKK